MPSTNDIASRIVSTLSLSEPDLDTSIGSPVRKIIDAVSTEVSLSQSDSFLATYQYDIDSKTTGDLDDFVANFGMARLVASRATGVVTFSRSSSVASKTSAHISPTTQIRSLTTPSIYVQTTISATIPIGQTSIDVPVIAIAAGPAGNIASGTLRNLQSPIDGISSVTNSGPLTGGLDQETDAQLRARFKTTVFRNLAGTDAMYRGLALQTKADPTDPTSTAVTNVNILGSIKHASEQLQVVSGTASSTFAAGAYIFAGSVFVVNSTGVALNRTTNYTVAVNNAVNPASIAITTVGSGMPDGIYRLEYDYVPTASRNDPLGTRFNQGNVNNRVDIYVNGSVLGARTQSVVFVNTVRFNTVVGDPLQTTRFTKLNGTAPANNDVFVPLAYGPIVTAQDSITIGGTTYTEGTHYDIVHQSDAFGYSPNSAFGLAWKQASLPANNSVFSLTYSDNVVPARVQETIANWRLLGTDVQVHAGKPLYLKFNFAVVYLPNFVVSNVNSAIQAALSNYLVGLGFDASVQLSDVTHVVHTVPGVDNVRFLTSPNDSTTAYAIQLVQYDGTLISTYQSSGRALDIYFKDNEYPVLSSINIVVKANNTFRS